MKRQREISGWIVFSAILSSILFYIVLFTISKWFPGWTGRTLWNEWVLVVVSSIPVIVVLIFLIVERLTKAKFGDLEFEFGEAIPPNLIDPTSIQPELLTGQLRKRSRSDLPRILRDIQSQAKPPKSLLVLLDSDGKNIDFGVMREYIYELSRVSPLEYIVFLNEDVHYIGFVTVEKFKERFPKFGVEIFIDDLRNEDYMRRIARADLPVLYNQTEARKYREIIEQLIRAQWDNDRNGRGVRSTDIQRLGAIELRAYTSWSVEKIYSLLIREDLKGVPIVDDRENFVGISTQDKIASAVILRLVEKVSNQEN